jgi:hypothetical protein
LLLVALALVGCKSEARKQHEALALSLRDPVALLRHAYHPEEGGGCNYTCHQILAVDDAHWALQAADAFLAIPPFSDPRTEAELGAIRAASRDAKTDLGAVCGMTGETWAKPTPEMLVCWSATQASHAIGRMITGVDALAEEVKGRTGALLPVMRGVEE